MSKKIFGIHTSALLETVVFLVLLVGADAIFGSGTRFTNVYPHPFWIIVLLISVQYGTIDGIVCVFVTTLFLYMNNLPSQNIQETLFEYQFRISLRPFLWFTTTCVLGEMRMRLHHEKESLKTQLMDATEQLEIISHGYELIKATKENVERRLAGQLRSLASAYELIKEMETLEPGRVILSIERIICFVLNPKKFSVFAFGNLSFEAATAYGWKDDDHYIRRFQTDHPLTKDIVNRRCMLCVVNKKDEGILGGEGLVVVPLIDSKSDQIFGFIKIEEIDFFDLNVSNLETFKKLSELIGLAYSNAKQFQVAQKMAVYGQKDSKT